ncbi:MAG: hypothetical protein H0T89_28750 [Deltaproteobacteria bacterium]|nr:hypothetical protein [Deltaproteobacteria bacterium]MDQ3295856.1 Ig-like domain-containing protein [Myxococcota bacterium]
MGIVHTGVITFVLVCAIGGPLHAQTTVFAGANAQASPGGGTHSVLLIGGQYFVFFNDGTSVVYATSRDGVTFSAPMPASGAPANLSFSVARRGNTLGLVWAHADATGYSISYREATIAGASLSFGAPTLVATHATDTRGYLATLAYSAAGTPYIAAIEFGQTYVGPAGPGCGSTARYRPIHYVRQNGAWQMRGYCNNFDAVRDPNSIAIAPSGANMIIASALDANMSTAIVSDVVELAEPWHLVPAVDHVLAAQLSAAQSLTVATDVHLLYRDGAGAVSYARQDGTAFDLNAAALDVTVLNSLARNPALSRPATAAGCYVAAYTVDNTIRRRTFSGTIASLSVETTAYATATTPTNLSAELDAATAPALVWQEANAIKLGFAAGGGAVTLSATPATAPADGSATIAFSSTAFRDACATPIPAGSLVTVTTSVGTIADSDASTELEGTQVFANASGEISFSVRAPTTAGIAVVAAMPITGGTNTRTQAVFTDPLPQPGTCGDRVVDVAAGEQCDSGGVDTEACNADCQPPRCGDGHVNVAANEACEAGTLCDLTTCTYEYSVGGGCAGCGASGGHDALLSVTCASFAIARRRRRRLSRP